MYDSGQGVAQDYAEAAAWYRKAAEQGDAVAQFNLGSMYFKGKGAQRGLWRGRTMYHMAAVQGYAQAQYSLGLMYCEGNGVPQDPVQAYLWLNLAAEQEIETADIYLDVLAEHMTLIRYHRPGRLRSHGNSGIKKNQ